MYCHFFFFVLSSQLYTHIIFGSFWISTTYEKNCYWRSYYCKLFLNEPYTRKTSIELAIAVYLKHVSILFSPLDFPYRLANISFFYFVPIQQHNARIQWKICRCIRILSQMMIKLYFFFFFFFFFYSTKRVSIVFFFFIEGRVEKARKKKITKASATEFTKSNYDITFITSSYV